MFIFNLTLENVFWCGTLFLKICIRAGRGMLTSVAQAPHLKSNYNFIVSYGISYFLVKVGRMICPGAFSI